MKYLALYYKTHVVIKLFKISICFDHAAKELSCGIHSKAFKDFYDITPKAIK